MKRGVVWVVLLAVAGVFGVSGANAATFNSPNFSINGSVGDSVAGPQTSTNYRMTSAGGESIVGDGSSGSYKLGYGYVPRLERSLQLTTQPEALEAYFSLDEQVGTVAYDDSSNNRNGQYGGGPTTAAGKVGASRNFNGTDQGVLVPDFDISGTITYSAWFYPETTQTSKVIGKNSDTFNSQALLGLTNGRLFAVTGIAGTGQFMYGPFPALNKWTHAAVTYDGARTYLYVNGVEWTSFATTGAVATNNFDWGIGRNGNSSGGNFDGNIDEVKIYSRALSADEIKAEYRAGTEGRPAGIGLGAVTPGASRTSQFNTVVQTDAPGYSVGINQDHDLNTSGAITPERVETYDSVSSGTTLTTANTNANQFVSGGTGSTPIASSASTIHGNFARYASGSNGFTYQNDTYAEDQRLFTRFYFRLDSLPSSALTLWNLYQTGSSVSGVLIDPTGEIRLRNVFSTVATSNHTVVPGQWYRLEVVWDRPMESQTLRLFYGSNVNGSRPNETLTGLADSAQTFANVSRVGVVNGSADLTVDVDEYATGTSDWLGPAGSGQSIAPVSGSIASPVGWSEGSTKGLGFTLHSTNATVLPGKWSSGNAYAAMPNSSTSFYTRTGYSGGTKDVHGMRLRLDVPASQPVGDYSNRMTIIGTMTP